MRYYPLIVVVYMIFNLFLFNSISRNQFTLTEKQCFLSQSVNVDG